MTRYSFRFSSAENLDFLRSPSEASATPPHIHSHELDLSVKSTAFTICTQIGFINA
jgi:hypothetical protein